MALGPTRRWHLPYNEALPVPWRSAHLSRGAAHAQLLVSHGVCLRWQQLLDQSRHDSSEICWLCFSSGGKVNRFSLTKWDDVIIHNCMVCFPLKPVLNWHAIATYPELHTCSHWKFTHWEYKYTSTEAFRSEFAPVNLCRTRAQDEDYEHGAVYSS